MRLSWFCAALIFGICLIHQVALGDEPKPAPTVLQVAADGSTPYRTIQAAIAAAPAYAVIRIAPGTYPESLTINKHLTLEGADASTTHVQGRWLDLRDLVEQPGELPPERKARLDELIAELKKNDGERFVKSQEALWTEFGSKPTLQVSGARVVLRGLRFSMLGPVREGGWTQFSMIDCENASGRVEHCAFVGSAVGGWKIRGATDLVFRDTLFAGIRISAIDAELPPTSRLVLERCEVRSIGYRGLQLHGGGNVEISHCRLASGVFSLNGLAYGEGLRAQLHHNLVLGSCSTSGADQVVFDHNTFVGMEMPQATAGKLHWAMHLVDDSKPTLTANLFVRYQHGVMLNQSSEGQPVLRGNVFDTAESPLARLVMSSPAGNAPARLPPTIEAMPVPDGNVRGPIRFKDLAAGDFTLDRAPMPLDRAGATEFHRVVEARPELPEERRLWEDLTRAKAARR